MSIFKEIATPANMPCLIWAGTSVAVSILLGLAARAHLATLPDKTRFSARLYRRLIIPAMPAINVLLLLVGVSVLKDRGLTTALIPALNDIALTWFVVAAVYAVTESAAKTFFTALVAIPFTLLSLFGLMKAFTGFLKDISFTYGKTDVTALQAVTLVITGILLFWAADAAIRTVDFSLQKILHLRHSTRQLLVSVAKIVLYAAAALLTLRSVGIDLTAFAIFGGAIGVGLGFGLQKLASNFISGILLLLERSINVGDMIEVGTEIIGTVRHIGARYTLVETGDNREIMVPNEEFISQRVTNLTYSNTRGQVALQIGVSYDSDLDLVRQLLLTAASEHPAALRDPAPLCFLREFGDSAVTFKLLFWIADVRTGKWGPQSDVMFSIWNKFKANGISMPYPQRDVHIKLDDAKKIREASGL